MRSRFVAAVSLFALLSGCGGGGDDGGNFTGSTPTGSATPTPTTAAGCSLTERQNWAAAQLREWYLFPDLLPATLSPAGYTTVDDYIDALTATARSQRKDRYFTYLTSIKAENAYYDAGASGGFGIRLSYDNANRRVFVSEAFEGAPALAAGIDRGTEILAVGSSSGNLVTVSALMSASGAGGVVDALGPDTAGTTRVFRIASASGGTREVTVAKADYTLAPISSRYGAQIISDGGNQVGYVNLRTFIETADPALREAFARFKAAGVTQVIVDVRYNGGGLIKIAELFSDLLGGARSTSEVQSYTVYRSEKSASNSTRLYQRQTQAIAPTRIAFIGTGGTASASELVINAAIPYLRANAALVGTNTYGKPVGQIARDYDKCDDRLRIVALATQNASRQGDYYDGLASKVEASCRATDDTTYQMGDPREASTRAALDFLAGRVCSPITGDASAQSVRASATRTLLSPTRPTTAQREVPGLF
ncbi:S41 family peptidase [Sphingomonas mollis]|uniref:Peptidase S41 n=1 Tax=Sphingomonas mollis TaxID=2795726 RepID=A0ABS0XS40_9SPHN|nr:S41 family peptidase [Sphingomonas sp. BT553]MBJ6122864.1 peptidase S41 [Sphingomonas sp. BT553]